MPRHLSGLVGKYNDAFIQGDHKRPVLLTYNIMTLTMTVGQGEGAVGPVGGGGSWK